MKRLYLHDAMTDRKLFGKTFAGKSFENWRTVAKILDGRPLKPSELAFYREITGRDRPPSDPFTEAYLIKPRRAGGTLFEAAFGLHAALQDYRDKLGPGEIATVAMIASDRKQARQLMNYVKGLISDSPVISAEVKAETVETIAFAHRTQLEIHTGSFRSTRGYSFAAVLLDELAFFRDEYSANPDVELIRAVRPGLSNLGGRLLGFSSPHARRGHLFDMFTKHYGKDSDVLVLKAQHSQLNPTIDPKIIERAMAEDPEAAKAEWFGEFRGDVTQWLPDDLIDAAIEREAPRQVLERPSYAAFVDMSGGRHDASVLAIAHSEPQQGPPLAMLDHLDVVLAPHEPAAVVERFAATLKRYGIHSVTGDRYAGSWVSDAFQANGIRYDSSELDKSAIYGEVLPLFAERRVKLIDDKRLVTELRLLERRPRPGGRADRIDHGPSGHDDAANAACGALWLTERLNEVPGGFFRVEMFLEAGEPVVLSRRPDDVFAVIGAPETGRGQDSAAVLYCARTKNGGWPLVLIDHEIVPHETALMADWIFDVARRLGSWVSALHSASAGIWAEPTPIGAPLLELGARRGLAMFDINHELPGFPSALPERVALASRYLGSGRLVRIGADAYEKSTTLRGITKNHLLSQILAYGSEKEKAEQQTGFLHALCVAAVIALPGNPDAEKRLAEADTMPHVMHGPEFSQTAARLAKPEPAAPRVSYAALVEKYQSDLADYKEREREAIEAIRTKLGDPNWRPRSYLALNIGPPPENPASRMRLTGFQARAMIEDQ